MKKILSLILTLFCVLSLVGCGRSMDDIIKNESSITGVVEEVYNNSMMLPGIYVTPRKSTVDVKI